MKLGLRSRGLLASATVIWLCAVFAGTTALMRYKNAAGAQIEPAAQWPTASAVPRARGHATLVLAAHPHCPCTRASVTELDRLLMRAGGRLQAVVLFVKPRGAPEGWEKGDLWTRVAAMPAAKPMLDVDGVEAHRFRALTSGQTVVYDDDGNLLFSGGITAARGHEGDSVGRGLILAALDGARLEHARAPVFGCALDTPENGGTP
jgi:hypothetical protein